MQLTIGKIKGLQLCSSPEGTFTCLALDHRQNLRRSLNPENPEEVPDSDLTNFKLTVTRHLAGKATAVLLDPEYSAAQAITAGVIPTKTGLVVALEATGYTGKPNARESRILPGWSVKKAKLMGANMIKLLIYYHPNASIAEDIEQFVYQIAEECRAFDIALMLEPLSYSLDPDQSQLSSEEKRQVVITTARNLTPLGVNLLKAEFPLGKGNLDEKVWAAACSDLAGASHVPWILLSAAVDFETYLRQVEVACDAGASGIAVGRAVWKEAVLLKAADQEEFLKTTAKERLSELSALCRKLGKSWMDFFPNLGDSVPDDWYSQYDGK